MTDTEKGDNNAVKPSDKFYMNIDYVGNCPVCKKHGHVMTRCAECLGKDNNGMVPLDKEETINFLSVVLQTAWIKYKNFFGEQPHGTQKQLLAMLEFCIEEICAKFSQQPPKEQADTCNCHIDDDDGNINYCEKHEPKERKVSLEDIAIELWSLFDTNNEIKWSEIHESLRHFYMIRAQAILSLLNATEERKGE